MCIRSMWHLVTQIVNACFQRIQLQYVQVEILLLLILFHALAEFDMHVFQNIQILGLRFWPV